MDPVGVHLVCSVKVYDFYFLIHSSFTYKIEVRWHWFNKNSCTSLLGLTNLRTWNQGCAVQCNQWLKMICLRMTWQDLMCKKLHPYDCGQTIADMEFYLIVSWQFKLFFVINHNINWSFQYAGPRLSLRIVRNDIFRAWTQSTFACRDLEERFECAELLSPWGGWVRCLCGRYGLACILKEQYVRNFFKLIIKWPWHITRH